jgi:2-succinyl-6-hydroxy-2,4-cyclohexadiene-1-carboxylate synthase
VTDPRHHFVDARGVRLHLAEWPGAPDAPALVVLHGFTGSIESMEGTIRALAKDRSRPGSLWAVDLVGHGESDCPGLPDAYSMDACVDQVVDALNAVGLQRADWLGYSMGGRVALSAAVRRPERVRRAVLVGASPGIAASGARAARVRDDEALAARLLDRGIEAFVDEWMARPIFASQRRLGPAALAAARAQRLRGNAAGWAASLRGMGTGSMPPLHDALEKVDAPVLLVVGEEDAKFRGLAEELARGLRHARIAILPGAGHAAHLERPEEFGREIARFLDAPRTNPRPDPRDESRRTGRKEGMQP